MYLKEQRIIEALSNVDEKYIEEAAPVNKKRKKPVWIKWTAVAACLAIVVGGVFLWKDRGNDIIAEPTFEETVAYGFTMGDAVYFPISFEDRIRFGLVPEDAMGLTPENTYEITEDDLGEVMGIVETSDNESLVGATVYHFAKYPEYDAICIVEVNGEYSFYTSDGLLLTNEIGKSSDFVLEAYNMPQSVTKITVQTGEWETVMTITDEETIATICDIMKGKANIGLKEHEKLYAKLWYDTYGNDDVYYDEEVGSMIYREAQTEPPEPVTYTDADGNEVTYYESNTEDYDKAHALWGEGERVVTFTTDKGFEFYMNYRPSISTIGFYDGYYLLTEGEVEELNDLLGVE